MRLIDADKLKEAFYNRKRTPDDIKYMRVPVEVVYQFIDNAPTVEKTILKRRDVNKCLNCIYCCEASITGEGEVYIMCNFGAYSPTKEGKE